MLGRLSPLIVVVVEALGGDELAFGLLGFTEFNGTLADGANPSKAAGVIGAVSKAGGPCGSDGSCGSGCVGPRGPGICGMGKGPARGREAGDIDGVKRPGGSPRGP